MITRTYRFQPVWTQRSHTGNCPVCGRKTIKKKSFEQTVNPFNKNEDGSVKTRDEVYESLKIEADAWVPDFRHQKCGGV
jgi:hypothetical protein